MVQFVGRADFVNSGSLQGTILFADLAQVISVSNDRRIKLCFLISVLRLALVILGILTTIVRTQCYQTYANKTRHLRDKLPRSKRTAEKAVAYNLIGRDHISRTMRTHEVGQSRSRS